MAMPAVAADVSYTTVLSGSVVSVAPVGAAVKGGDVLLTVNSLAGPMPAAVLTRMASSRPSSFSRDHKCSKAPLSSWWKRNEIYHDEESLRLAAYVGRVCLTAALSCILALSAQAQEFMNVSEVQPGMTGYAKTVVHGTTIDTFPSKS